MVRQDLHTAKETSVEARACMLLLPSRRAPSALAHAHLRRLAALHCERDEKCKQTLQVAYMCRPKAAYALPSAHATMRSGLIHTDDTKTKKLGSDLYEVGQQEVRQLVQHCAALTTRLRCSCYAICGRPPPLQHIFA